MSTSAPEHELAIYKGLVRVSSLINAITDFDELLRAILDVARGVFGAEAASLFIADPKSGELQLTLAVRGEGAYVEPRIVVPRGRGLAGWVWQHGESLLIDDAYQDSRFFAEADLKTGFKTRSVISAPLRFEGRSIGVLQLLNAQNKPVFEPVDLEGLEAYSALTATAIEKLRSFEQSQKEALVRRDLAIASDIQSQLLQQSFSMPLEGLEVAHYNQPAQDVGGDFYDSAVDGRGLPSVYIGDVSGKGISAALLMARITSMLGLIHPLPQSNGETLNLLNRALADQVVRGMFVTLLGLSLHRDSPRLELASAGHCRPLLLRSGQPPRELEVPGALPIGILPETKYQSIRHEVEAGDILVLFTDGLSESRDPVSGALLGDELISALHNDFSSAQACLDCLVSAENHFRRGTPRRDDLTIVVLKIKG